MKLPFPDLRPGKIQSYGALPVPRLTPDLLSLVKTGAVYSLAVLHKHGIPVPGPMAPYTLNPSIRHGDIEEIAPASAAAELISMAGHTGTHIDALCHIGEHRNSDGEPEPGGAVHLYADQGQSVRAEQAADTSGQHHLSIAEMPPIVQRAVLLDVAAGKGMDILPDAYQITAEDIAQTAQKQRTEIHQTTAVLIRTGFYQHLAAGNPVYREAIAGLGLDAARYLHEQGMNLVGADNMTVEAMPPFDHSVHRYLLVQNGITHLENLFLEELAQQKVYEFLLIVTPLRLVGATASWVHPIAIA